MLECPFHNYDATSEKNGLNIRPRVRLPKPRGCTKWQNVSKELNIELKL